VTEVGSSIVASWVETRDERSRIQKRSEMLVLDSQGLGNHDYTDSKVKIRRAVNINMVIHKPSEFQHIEWGQDGEMEQPFN
jgi:hypothetical protein